MRHAMNYLVVGAILAILAAFAAGAFGATTQPAAAGPDAVDLVDQIAGPTLTLIGLLTGAPLLVVAGALIGRYKLARALADLIRSVQAGRGRLQAHDSDARKVLDLTVQAAMKPATQQAVARIKKKLDLATVSGPGNGRRVSKNTKGKK